MQFLMIDVGAYGRCNDGGVFSNSNFGAALLQGKMDLPPDANLPNSSPNDPPLPHVFLADEAFPLKPFILKSRAF